MPLGWMTALMLAAPPPAGTYTLDPERTVLLVQLRPDRSRLLSGLSHSHVVRARKPQGTIRFDPRKPKDCAVRVTAMVRDLEVDAPEMRKRVGYEDVLSDEDRTDVRENMMDKGQLDSRRYPDISFVGSQCAWQPDGQLAIDGRLSVRGMAHKLTVFMTVRYRGGALRAKGAFTLTHAAFGFDPYSTALGTLANDDWLRFTVQVVARRPSGKLPRVDTTTTAVPIYR